MEITEELKVKISNITGEVDEETLVNLGAAQQLIDDIFTLDSKETKTSEEAQLLIEKINTLNSMGIPGLHVDFDETTGSVQGTRAEIQGLIDDLLRQYETEALHDAAVEAYKAQYESMKQIETVTETSGQALTAYKTAVSNLTAAQQELNDAEAAWNEFKTTNEGYWTNYEDGTDSSVYKRYTAAKEAAELATAAVEETQTAVEESLTVLEESQAAYDAATETIEGISKKLTELSATAKEEGENFFDGYTEGTEKSAPKSKEAIITAGNDMIDALRDTLDSHSPSRVTEQEGVNAMEGLELGIKDATPTVTNAMQTVVDGIVNVVSSCRTALQTQMQTALGSVTEAVAQMSAVWQSDWGRPRVHFPVFSLIGNIDFQTGQMPQITISDWLWAAKGGILDKATLIGAGEAGKEALIPLERNTEWVNIIADGIQDTTFNSTRFIGISKDLEIYPDANKFSVMLSIPHRPGSLAAIISKFAAIDVNLTKIEARALPGMDFEYLFTFDFMASPTDPNVLSLLSELSQDPEDERCTTCMEKAWEHLNAPTLKRDGYHALTVRKCLSCFDRFGYFLYAKELRERIGAR